MFLYKSDSDVKCPECEHEFMDYCEQDADKFDDSYPQEFYQCPKCRFMLDIGEVELGWGNW